MQQLSSNTDLQSAPSIYSIKLDVFEGPLDLLLHLIQKNEMDIREISIAEITEQYLDYLNFIELLDLDIASEFLMMAATLLHLKSQSILPSITPNAPQLFKDREELVRQLLEYKRFKEAGQVLDAYATKRERSYGRNAELHTDLEELRDFQIRATLFDLISAFQLITNRDVYIEDDLYEEIQEEIITIEEKMEFLEHRVNTSEHTRFSDLFTPFSRKIDAIITFLAMLELIRLKRIIAVQPAHFEEIVLMKCQSSQSGAGNDEAV